MAKPKPSIKRMYVCQHKGVSGVGETPEDAYKDYIKVARESKKADLRIRTMRGKAANLHNRYSIAMYETDRLLAQSAAPSKLTCDITHQFTRLATLVDALVAD